MGKRLLDIIASVAWGASVAFSVVGLDSIDKDTRTLSTAILGVMVVIGLLAFIGFCIEYWDSE